MKQVQHIIIRSVEYSAQRRRISHEVWLVIALDELHPECISHGPFRDFPAFWICVRGGTLLWGKLCPVTLVCLEDAPFTIKRGAVYGIYGPWRLCFFNTRPVRESFAGRPDSHLRLVRCWWRRPIPDQICSPCSSTCTRLEDTGCWGEQGKSR